MRLNYLYFILAAIIYRIIILNFINIHDFEGRELLLIARGFSADIAISLIFYFIFYKFTKLGFVLFAIVLALDAMHVGYNFSHLNILHYSYALDKNFIFGNVLNIYLLLTVLAIVGLSYILVRLINSKKEYLYVGVMAIGLTVAIPINIGYSDWVQTNFIENIGYNIYEKYFGNEIKAASLDNNLQSSQKGVESFFKLDLAGKQIAKYEDDHSSIYNINRGATEKLPNILLIILERVGFVDLDPQIMPNLYQAVNNQGMIAANFLSLQDQTNRGLYAILCGDLPNLGVIAAKSEQQKINKRCLPQELKQYGYYNFFIQSADLGYMSKDKFCQNIKFDKILGKNNIKNYNAINSWGVDDLSLYKYALSTIKKSNKQPWFATILTTGTHLPYLVPNIRYPTRKQALKHADTALNYILEQIDDNTMVIITTDEIKHNRALLAILNYQGKKPYKNINYLQQTDIKLSILDYLQLPINYNNYGRSIFREYDFSTRELIYASTYANRIYYYYDNVLTSCTPKYECKAKIANCYPDSHGIKTEVNKINVEKIHKIIKKSNYKPDEDIFTEQNKLYTKSATILGGYKLAVKSGDIINWQLNLAADADSTVTWRLYFLKKWANNPYANIYGNNFIVRERHNVTGNSYQWQYKYRVKQDGIIVSFVDLAIKNPVKVNLFKLYKQG